MSKSTIFESSLSLVTIFYRDGEYFYNFVEGPDQGPYNEEREAYQEAMREMASILKGALIALHQVEGLIAEMREPFQDLRRITEI